MSLFLALMAPFESAQTNCADAVIRAVGRGRTMKRSKFTEAMDVADEAILGQERLVGRRIGSGPHEPS
jgi:hypothetical protein